MIMKIRTFILLLLSLPTALHAQLTIDEAQRLARENYPAISQYELITASRDFTLDNALKAWLPQVSLNGRASYQSDVTKLPIDLSQMGINYKGLSRDQYDAHVMVNQQIYDGGQISSRRSIARAQADVETQKLNVSLYDIRHRVSQLFFGILLLDEQLRQNQLLQDDLELSHKTVSAMVKGGIANQSDVDAVRVSQIQARQEEGSLKTRRHTYMQMLNLFIGKELNDDTRLQKPSDQLPGDENLRPELAQLNAQSRLLDAQRKNLDVALRPRLSAFAQGGYGNPALNMLKDGFDTYYKVGLTLSWNLGALYTRKNDKKLIDLQRSQIDAQRRTFLFNQSLQHSQTRGEIDNYRSFVSQDDEIITLRESIRRKSEKKVQNGTETVNEMLRDINAVSEARQQKAVHEVQLLQQIYEIRNINNN